MRSPAVDKAQLSTPNTRAQYSLDSANANESVAQQNISGDGANATVVDELQATVSPKSVRNASENAATSQNSAVTNDERHIGSDLLATRNVFGSMVSINDDFHPSTAAAPKKTG